MTYLRFEEGRQLLKLALSALLASMLLMYGWAGSSQAAELRFNRAYVGTLTGQTFATTTLLNADPGSIRFADGGTQRAFQNTTGTLYYTVNGVQYSEVGVLNSRYPNGNTMIDAVAFTANSGGDRLLVLGGSYTAGTSYGGSSNAVVTKLNEYLDATAPDAGQTTLSVNGGLSATVSVGQTATILVTVKLSSGAGLAGANVTLNANPSANTTISPASAVTNSSGQATFSVQSNAAGSVTYSATASANGSTFTSTATVTVTSVGVRSPAQSSAVVPNGSAGLPTLVTITVRDSSGNPVTGAAAALSASIGGSNAGTSVSAIADRGGGSYGFSYTPTIAGTDAVSIKLDGTNISGSPYSSLVAAPTLSFAPAPGGLPNGSVGTAYSQTITATGGTAPYSFTTTGLPAGLNLNATTGTISGTPTTPGSYTMTVAVTDAHGATGSATYTVVISVQAPVAGASAVTVAANTTATTVPLSLTGGAATSVAVATAPSHGTATASGTAISYTPNVGFSGGDSFTYTATNSAGNSAPATVTVTVSAPALIISPAPGGLPNGTVGAGYSQTITATGGTAPYSFIATGLPAGLTLNAATGAVIGTPTTPGNYTIAVTATDTYGAGGTAAYALNIAMQAPLTGSTSLAVVANSAATSVPLSLSGGTATSVAVAAAPAHGIVTVSGTAISYAPNAGFSGSDSFTYTASNAAGTSAPATVTVTVSTPTLSFAPAPGGLPNGAVGADYNQTITVTGGAAPYSFTAAGLPAGLIVNAATGVISGAPTTAGSYNVTISVTDAHGVTGAATYTIAISVQAPVAGASTVAVGANSSATAIPLSLAGGAATSVAVATAPAHGTASASGIAISYAPNAGFSGTDSFTYTATNAAGISAPATVTVTVSAPTLVFSPAPGALPNGTVGTAYSQTITISGGTAPYSFTATGLPAGLTLNATTGAITGTPTTDGSFQASVTATDAFGAVLAQNYSIVIAPPPPPVAADSTSASVPANTETKAGQNVAINLTSLVSGEYTDIRIMRQPQHGSVAITRTVAMRAGGTPGIMAALAVFGMLDLPSQVIAIYTPDPNYHGPDSFQFAAVGPGGVSAPASVVINVVGRIPTAQALTANTLDGQAVLVDLTAGATEGPFVDAAIISVSPAQQAAAEIVPGGSGTSRSFKVRVTPKARFSGAVLVQYTLTNAFGTSAPAVVTVNVTRRPDPSADPVVQAISDGQAEAARRFSQAQVSNFLRRAETLHGDCGHSFNGVRVASRDLAPPAAEPRSDDPAEIRRGERTKETQQQQRANAKRGVETGCRSMAVWSGGTVELGTRDAATGRAKISAATSGLSGGVDAKVGDGLYLGAGAGLSRDISRIDGSKGRLFSKGTTLALYGSAAPVPGLFVDGVATTSWMTFRTRRTDATTGALASGERSGRLTSIALSIGIDRVSGPLGWSVYGRAATSNGNLHGYVEEGAGVYDLRFDSRAIRSTTGTLGFRTALRQPFPNGSMTVNLRGEWQHEFQGGALQGVDYADIAGPSVYRLRAQNWGREQFVLAPGIDLDLPADWQFSINLGFRGAEDERAMSTSVRARKQF
ncbi:putative Ig domain-containing protein [Sphingomonas trueperi]|uniref:putative Ig domain-containing protein n=1 Tax=Sphingomonas trueperi TaxID=53317 RepID=UPI000F1597AA